MTNTPGLSLQAVVDAAVDAWHDSKASLRDWLGWSWEEYAAWVRDPKAIPRAPKHFAAFLTTLEATPSLHPEGEGAPDVSALRGAEKLSRLMAWHHFGLKWEHMEKQSQAEVLAACQCAIDWLNQPLAARNAALTPSTVTEGTVPDDGVMVEADAEVERILSLSDDQVLAEASPEDLAWARLFKARMIAIKHALPGRYDGTSTYAVVRGDVDDAPYMLAIRDALTPSTVKGETVTDDRAASPRPWRIVPYGDGDSLVIHDARGDFRVCFMATPGDSPGSWEQIKANAKLIVTAVNALAASPEPTIVEASGMVER